MLTKLRNVPSALTLRPEVNLLTEFALIATSPQSPLVREVSGEKRRCQAPLKTILHLLNLLSSSKWYVIGDWEEKGICQIFSHFIVTSPVVGVIRKEKLAL